MLKRESEYEKQAREFAEKIGLTMTTVYLGHYPRLSSHVTANYRVTLTRKDRKPFSFDFSTSINDSWQHWEQGKFNPREGLPARIDIDKFFESIPETPFQYRGARVDKRKKAPTMYDVLACLTHYDPGTFKNFCSDYGYSDDSIKARDTWAAIVDEWHNVNRLFSDVLDELSEIN